MAFKNTILGKILKGVAKVAPFALAAASFVIPGGPLIAGGLGVAGKLITKIKGSIGGQLVGGVVNAVGSVGKAAVNLVTGTTADERDQVKDVQAEAKAAQDKLDQVQRLINAGATQAEANQMAGVTAADLGSANAAEKDQAATIELANNGGVSEATKAKVQAAGLLPTGGGCLITLFALLSGLGGLVFTFFLIF